MSGPRLLAKLAEKILRTVAQAAHPMQREVDGGRDAAILTRCAPGQSTIEFTFIAVTLILLVMSILDLGRGVYAYSVITAAAQEGARYVMINSGDTTGGANAVRSQAIGLDHTQLTISITEETGGQVTAAVTYNLPMITPLLGQIVGNGGVLHLHVAAAMQSY
jgi:hypothetical protein